jgi:thiol-disulfide isomerase/thioredoxin
MSLHLRRIGPLVLLLLPRLATASQVAFGHGTLDGALHQAAAQDKLVLVDVYATWCGPCQKLDEESFVHADVVAETDQHFVALKVDGERGEGPDIMHRYHVVGFPTLLVLRPDGNEVDRVFGFVEGPELAATLRGYREGQGTLAQKMEQLRGHPDDMALAAEVASRAIVRGDWATARPLVDRVVRSDRDNAQGRASSVLFQVARYHYLRGNEDWAGALRAFEHLRSIYPQSEEAQGGAFAIDVAKALHRMGRDAQGLAALEHYLGHGAGDSERYNTVGFFMFRERWLLPRAEGFCRRGLAVNPADDSLWDTFAEVLGARQKYDEAIAAEERAHQITPSSPYYTAQIDRFRQMRDAPAAPQESR